MYSSISAVASDAMSFSGPATSPQTSSATLWLVLDALDDHQVEDVQRDRDVPAEDLGELPVVLVERRPLAALDVEDADHLVVQASAARSGCSWR